MERYDVNYGEQDESVQAAQEVQNTADVTNAVTSEVDQAGVEANHNDTNFLLKQFYGMYE
ncbi:hypothetical protein [Paenibacillus terrigena]|uniref:hypothetical protein n=1 Tax=Paenibacillus terrigena TaxID=369333 RepID=UPI0028D87477|nr:hypothetical protein [Paenibacillus terrigena]